MIIAGMRRKLHFWERRQQTMMLRALWVGLLLIFKDMVESVLQVREQCVTQNETNYFSVDMSLSRRSQLPKLGGCFLN
jgi:hypothetical protein